MADTEDNNSNEQSRIKKPNRVVDSQGKTKGRVRYNPGRPRHCFTFDVARELARRENIGSVQQYIQWWMHNKPARMPKRPDRAYEKEFISWNDFLGNDNKFGTGQYEYKTYEEAKKYARTLNLRTQAEWIEYGLTEGYPDGIPTRPDLFYQKTYEWYTWSEFLGSSAQTIIDEARNTERVLYIVRHNNTPTNVYQIGLVNDVNDVYTNRDDMGFEVIKLFTCNDRYPLSTTLGKLDVSEYPGDYPNMYIVENYYDLIDGLEEAGVIFDIKIRA